jgi:hypothetical protein
LDSHAHLDVPLRDVESGAAIVNKVHVVSSHLIIESVRFGEGEENQKSDARALRQHSTVLVVALLHHAATQAHWHYRSVGVTEPNESMVTSAAISCQSTER